MVSLTVGNELDRTPRKNQRPQMPSLKKENSHPTTPVERYEE